MIMFFFFFIHFSSLFPSFSVLFIFRMDTLHLCMWYLDTWSFCSCLFRRLHVALFIYSFLIRRRSRDMYAIAMIFSGSWKIIYKNHLHLYRHFFHSILFVWLHPKIARSVIIIIKFVIWSRSLVRIGKDEEMEGKKMWTHKRWTKMIRNKSSV